MKNIADSLGMKVIVEGAENEFQQTELDSFGRQLGQGWLFGRPQTEANILVKPVRRPQKALTARIRPLRAW